MTENLALPGNPRYQPKSLQDFFGYDNIYSWLAKVELANLYVLYEIGVMPAEDFAVLTGEVEDKLMAIRTTEVDRLERAVTKHDVRAWVQLAQAEVDPRLARWIHVPLTSYDALDTARVLQFSEAFSFVTGTSMATLIRAFIAKVRETADVVQIGRTHGQHALPITVGFWLASILDRLCTNFQLMLEARERLVGKISGAVGASNAIVGLGFAELCGDKTYEERVLEKLGLKPALISTQILPPEPMAYFLWTHVATSAVLAQFGDDCRHLMRTEIGEISEPFGKTQVGSSTMAHKRNPINFEGLKGAWIKQQAEFLKVTGTLVSEHQRDLTGSSVYRDFPTIVVNLQTQLDTLLRTDDDGKSFIERINVHKPALEHNFNQSAHMVLAEPLYIALQMAGYEGDGHHLVNHGVVPKAQEGHCSLIRALGWLADNDPELEAAVQRIPAEIIDLLERPRKYTGNALERALSIADRAEQLIGAPERAYLVSAW